MEIMEILEFLDTEWYDRPLPTVRERDGWRSGPLAVEVFELPLSLVKSLAQPNRLAEVRLNDREHIEDLRGSLAVRGFDEPLTLVVDDYGRIVLKDGHHRLVAAISLKLPLVPVRVVRGRKIATSAVSLASVLSQLLLRD